jgi:hypothetical protein
MSKKLGRSRKGDRVESRRSWAQWKKLNHKLIRQRLDDRERELAARFSNLTSPRNNPEQSGNSSQTLEWHHSLGAELIVATYRIYSDVAADLGYKKSAGFVRSVYKRALLPALLKLKRTDIGLCRLLSSLPGRSGEFEPLSEIATGYGRELKEYWKARIDAEVTELQHSQKIERVALQRLSTGATAQPAQASGRHKPGKPASLTPRLKTLAGNLWRKNQGLQRRVRPEGLLSIANELDKTPFPQPSKCFGGGLGKQLREYNSKNGNSTRKIMTWTDLARHGDKDFVRGMRKLLSRCSSNVPN